MPVRIYDELHGFVELSELEQRLVDTLVFQRLRRIRQLSAAFLAYPGAVHTRFSHSLGAMHLAGRIAGRLAKEGLVPGDDVELLRVAALLHDVGHPPMSHTIEMYYKRRFSEGAHERLSYEIIVGDPEVSEILSGSPFTPREVADLVVGRHSNHAYSMLISSDLDVDRLDYLLRDAKHTGVAYGMIDLERIVSTLTMSGDNLALEVKGISALDSFYVARLHMYQAVYYHKTITGFELLLERIYELLVEELGFHRLRTVEGLVKMVRSGEFAYWDDVWLLHLIKEAAQGRLDVGSETRRLADSFLRRRAPQLVVDSSKLSWAEPETVSRGMLEEVREELERSSQEGDLVILDVVPVVRASRSVRVLVDGELVDPSILEFSLLRFMPRSFIVARVYRA